MGREIARSLESSGVKFIRVLWCDNANVIRAKAIHISSLERHLQHGVGLSPAVMASPVMFDGPVPHSGLGPVGEVRLVPDWSSLTLLPYSPGHARVMGDMQKDGKVWPLCPRGFLRRMIARADGLGLDVVAAFENEFYLLLNTTEAILPVDETVMASTFAMDLQRPVIDDIASALVQQDMEVEIFHPEAGAGQYEMTVHHVSALRAADQQVAFRETVHAMAALQHLKCSFLPKVFPNQPGSGCHVHLSLWRRGDNLMPALGQPYHLSSEARSFMAGVLDHLPALMALTAPIPNSYARLVPHALAGAYRCWGMDNREAAIRVPSHPRHTGPTNLELKTVDAASNPYLALGAIMAAGLDGLKRNLDLAESVDVDPATLSEAERARRGIDLLPTSLEESIDALSRDQALLEALGPDLARAFLAVRRAESAALSRLGPEGEVLLLMERY